MILSRVALRSPSTPPSPISLSTQVSLLTFARLAGDRVCGAGSPCRAGSRPHADDADLQEVYKPSDIAVRRVYGRGRLPPRDERRPVAEFFDEAHQRDPMSISVVGTGH
jgi:hypothetical protein